MSILVLGENFIDRYFIGTADRLSPEAPLPVVKIDKVENKPGGAGNVVANLKALGADVQTILPPSHSPVKNRLISNGHQIARWDEHDFVDRYGIEQLQRHKDLFKWAKGVIISDYAKGAFGPGVLAELYKLCQDKRVFIDTKRNPIEYKDLSYNAIFFPNNKEFFQFPYYVNCEQVLRKESANGMTYFSNGEPIHHEPAYISNPLSVSGAGDTVIAAFAYDQLAGLNTISHSMRFASKAAVIAIGKPLTSVATLDEIQALSR